MVINGLAEALLTTLEWLTGLSEEKEIRGKIRKRHGGNAAGYVGGERIKAWQFCKEFS